MAEKTLARQGYHLVGSGAVKPCLWLNRSLRGAISATNITSMA